jgi:hypothetical protein
MWQTNRKVNDRIIKEGRSMLDGLAPASAMECAASGSESHLQWDSLMSKRTDGQDNRTNGTDRSSLFTSNSLSSRNTSLANSMGNISSLFENSGHIVDDSDNCSIYSSGCSTTIGKLASPKKQLESRSVPRSSISRVPTAPPSSPTHSRCAATAVTPSALANFSASGGVTFQPPKGILGLPAMLNSELLNWDLGACALDSECTMADSTVIEDAGVGAGCSARAACVQDYHGGGARADENARMKADEDQNSVNEDGEGSECETESVGTSLAVEVIDHTCACAFLCGADSRSTGGVPG